MEYNRIFIIINNIIFEDQWPNTLNLMEFLEKYKEDIEGSCEGSGICGECNIFIPLKTAEYLIKMCNIHQEDIDSLQLSYNMDTQNFNDYDYNNLNIESIKILKNIWQNKTITWIPFMSCIINWSKDLDNLLITCHM